MGSSSARSLAQVVRPQRMESLLWGTYSAQDFYS